MGFRSAEGTDSPWRGLEICVNPWLPEFLCHCFELWSLIFPWDLGLEAWGFYRTIRISYRQRDRLPRRGISLGRAKNAGENPRWYKIR